MENRSQSANTALANDAMQKMLNIIDEFNQKGGVSSPVELITEMMYRQFMLLDELEEAGIKGHGPTARALNDMTFGAHLLIKFLIDLLGQYNRYERLTRK